VRIRMTSQERYASQAQLEHLQAKYVGTGHADTTKLCADPDTAAPARTFPSLIERILQAISAHVVCVHGSLAASGV
jgi:hypothetical protein